MFSGVLEQQLLWVLLVSAVMGAVVNRTGFCTMGAVSDWVNMGHKGRLRAWLLAIAVALVGAVVMDYLDLVDLDGTRPPYRSAVLAWPRYLLGGLMFGIGMTLASGCGNKNLVRIGGGSLKAVVVFLVAGACAYLMTRTAFFAIAFHSWIDPVSLRLDSGSQDLGSLLAGTVAVDPALLRLVLGAGLGVVILVFVMASRDFRRDRGAQLGGLVVGLAVLAGWQLTGGVLGQAVLEEAEWLDARPEGLGVQSFTFINPMGETLSYLASGADRLLLTYGVVAVAGVIAGSFLHAIFSRAFRVEWFVDLRDFGRHAAGAVLMGIGGVLGLGCTIGQGVTGVSTLALGSFMTLAATVFGAALAMKTQYYRLLYEDASFADALLTALVELRALPSRLRRLEAM